MTHHTLLAAVCVLVIGVYGWWAESGCLELWGSTAENNYYNLLVDGFRAGQLNLKRALPSGPAEQAGLQGPIPASAVASNPLGLIDLSSYKGKLYFYFGVMPALLLFWPYAALTGHYLLHKDAVVCFFSLGFLTSVWLVWAVWRRYFAAVGAGVVAACALAVGWTNFSLPCLPRGGVYEVAISCGYAMVMLTLVLLWQALHARRGRFWWLAGASLACGLAVAARPSLLFGAVMLFVPVVPRWRKEAVPGQPRQLWTQFLAATAPIMAIGLALMLYNFLRFDNPFEFGHRYAMSGAGQHMTHSQYESQTFSLRFFWVNFRVYFLELARWSARFPFVLDIRPPFLPAGHVGFEHVFGILPNVPLVWFALAAPLAWRGRWSGQGPALCWLAVMLVLLFAMCALTLCLFFAACNRYQVDFLPALVLLAVLGILGLERTLAGWPVWRQGIRWGWSLLLALSVFFNLCLMLERSADYYVYRGLIALRGGRINDAVIQFQEALKLQPENAEALSNLGTALCRQGRVNEAIAHLEQALRLKPDYAYAQNNLGTALLRQGKVAEAIDHMEQALRLEPRFADAHFDLASALVQQGRLAEAIGHLEQALRIRPEFAEAHYDLASALVQQGRGSEAIGHLEQALRINPGFAEAHNNLGVALRQQGQVTEAIGHYEQALWLKPDFIPAHISLAVALVQLGRCGEAIPHLEQALRLKPDFAQAQLKLAWVLATCGDANVRNGPRAVELAEGLNRLTRGNDAALLDTLAAAYAEAVRFAEAVQTAQAAMELAKSTGQADLAQQIVERLKLYQAGRPYRQE